MINSYTYLEADYPILNTVNHTIKRKLIHFLLSFNSFLNNIKFKYKDSLSQLYNYNSDVITVVM